MNRKRRDIMSRNSKNNNSSKLGIGIFLVAALIVVFWNDLKAGKTWAIIMAAVIVIAIAILLYFFVIKKYFIKQPIPSITMKEIDKMTGIEFENFVGDLYEIMGYKVEVTQASKDYGADVLVEKNQIKTVIQAKNYKNPVGYGAIQEVLTAKSYYKADESIVITNSYSFTYQARKASKELRVHLIAREDLQKLIDKYMKPLVEEKKN